MLADAFSPRGSNAGRYGRGIRCKCAYGGTLLAVAALRVLLMGAAGPVEATPDNRLQVLKSKAMLIALDEHADAVTASRVAMFPPVIRPHHAVTLSAAQSSDVS